MAVVPYGSSRGICREGGLRRMHDISLYPRVFHPAHARRRWRRMLPALILALLPACAAGLTVVPRLPESAALARSVGVRLEHDGGPEYVPRTLRIESGAPLTVRYRDQLAWQRS